LSAKPTDWPKRPSSGERPVMGNGNEFEDGRDRGDPRMAVERKVPRTYMTKGIERGA
jgi:hypothetical protein